MGEGDVGGAKSDLLEHQNDLRFLGGKRKGPRLAPGFPWGLQSWNLGAGSPQQEEQVRGDIAGAA